MLIRRQFQHIIRDDVNVVVEIEQAVDGTHDDTRKAQARLRELMSDQAVREECMAYYDDSVDILCFQDLLQAVSSAGVPPCLL